MKVEVERRFAGPPTMGHGGYVTGLLASRTKGAVQVTLRRPTPLAVPLELVAVDDGGQRWKLRRDGEVLAESEPADLDIDVPPPPTPEAARAARHASPSFANGTGVHPTCFGCGVGRPGEPGLEITAGPVEAGGVAQVAAVWTPTAGYADADGSLDAQWVLSALDCPGAFAFISYGTPAGLLGRIVFEQYAPVRAGEEHVVTGWQIGTEGRKLFAGTALFTSEGDLLAAAKATWFGV